MLMDTSPPEVYVRRLPTMIDFDVPIVATWLSGSLIDVVAARLQEYIIRCGPIALCGDVQQVDLYDNGCGQSGRRDFCTWMHLFSHAHYNARF